MPASFVYDGLYFRSISGISKSCCLLCCFIGCLSVLFSAVHFHNLRGAFYISAVLLSICCNGCLLLAHLFQLWQRKFYHWNVQQYESYLQLFLALLVYIASGIALSLDVVTYSVAAFFGLLASCFHVLDARIFYQLSRKRDAATQTDAGAFQKTMTAPRHM